MSPVELRGSLFRTDARRVVRGALEDALEEAGRAGVRAVQDELTPGHGVATGSFERSLRHKRTGLSDTVYSTQPAKAAWLEGTSRRNRTTSFPGYRIFTRSAAALDRRAGEIGRRAAADVTRELGG